LTAVKTIVAYGLQEALRRRVFAVVLLLTFAFLVLYWIANRYVFDHISDVVPPAGIDARAFAAAFVFGMAIFGTLFLGVVLAVFLTLGVVRGDAERGLLQPLVVRPVGRTTLLIARFLGAAAVCVPYTLVVYFAAMVITGVAGDWWPDRILTPALEIAAAVLVVASLSLLGSVFLSTVANGIAIFMLFGAGLVAGLLGSVGHALNSHGLIHAAKVAAWAMPFEALYQDALRAITESTSGLTGFLLRLGPFGGAESGGASLRLWSCAYFAVVAAVTLLAFGRRDL
jgi:ABC-type transport system involved in multi-copper enzyme maturation permease subunit